MSVTINGKRYPLDKATTLAQLFDALGVKTAKRAVEHNGEIVAPPAYATTPVASGDRIEVIQFVGGG